MRARDYTIMQRAVEEGVAAGWRRAHKHTDRPGEDAVCSAIWSAVTDAISEVFDFDETSGDGPQSDLQFDGWGGSHPPSHALPVLPVEAGPRGSLMRPVVPEAPAFSRTREQQAKKNEKTSGDPSRAKRGQRVRP